MQKTSQAMVAHGLRAMSTYSSSRCEEQDALVRTLFMEDRKGIRIIPVYSRMDL